MNTKNREVLQAAVVGGGAFGETHLRTLASMPQVRVGGVYTLEPARGEALCQRYGGQNYRSLAELAGDSSLDFVVIATPEQHHCETFRILAGQGKALYVEKPLATSLAEAAIMRDISRSIVAMSGHCLRFEHRLATVFERLRDLTIHHMSFRNHRTRLEKETYGRVHPAYAMLIHEIELSNAFAKSPFSRVMALETSFSTGQVDGMTILIEYENGVTSTVEGGWYLPAQTGCSENDLCSILSEEGLDELAIPHQGYYRIGPSGLETPNLFYGHSVYGVEYGPLRAALDYFVHCLLRGEQPAISTIQDAFAAVEVVEGALRSARESRWFSRAELNSL